MIKLVHPYTDLTGGEWLRGNLHTHTTRSDGARHPQRVIDDYAARGYGFLMFADHDVFTSDAAYRQWNDRGLVLIPGNELAGGPHLLHVDADRAVASRPNRQDILNEITAAARESGRGFAIVNHPDWESQFNHCAIEQLREWTGYAGIEIYNGVIQRLDGSPYATNKWDLLLSAGRRVWGFANDDSHRDGDVELGWNVAYVKERSRAGVVEALQTGRFYSSTGVTIKSLRVEGMTVRIETENAHRIVGIKNVGARFAVADGPTLEATVPENATYARFVCWGAGERFAWTQPFFVEGRRPRGKTPYLRDWRVSRLLEHGSLDKAKAEEGYRLATVGVQSQTGTDPVPGFVDVRAQIKEQPGVLYLAADIPGKATGRRVLSLGYDGPIRAWLNRREIFHGPGTNPAIPDRLALYVGLRRGVNRLVVALDTNNGRAWGLFGRVR